MSAEEVLTRQELEGKMRSYEEFANERLRTDLHRVLVARDAVLSDIGEYQQLATVVETLREQQQEAEEPHEQGIKTLVDLGANFYARARTFDTTRVFVCVGFGFFVEFTHDEALDFIEKKVERLREQARQFSVRASAIRARIQLVLEALNELTFGHRPPRGPMTSSHKAH